VVTRERLKQLMTYTPESGEFRWIKTRARGAMRGQVAGRIANTGYMVIGVDGALYTAHRLAFIYMTGDDAKNQLTTSTESKQTTAGKTCAQQTDR